MSAASVHPRTVRRIVAGLAVLAALVGPAAPAALAQTAAAPRAAAAPALGTVATPTVGRLAGPDRYATSVAVTRAAFPTGTHPPVVYLVTGAVFADALSAGAAAAAQGGAVLLSAAASIPATVRTELARLSPAEIVVVGGTGALSAAVARDAGDVAPVTRVAGADRYATSEALVRRAFSDATVSSVWVATGRDYPDALVTGAAAGSERSPVLVVDGRAAHLRASAAALVEDLAVGVVHVSGGTAAVSAPVVAELEAASGAAVRRHAGADRYATAVAVNRAAYPELTTGSAFIASGTGFADALAGSFYAARSQRPLYLSVPYCVPAVVRPDLTRAAVTSVRLLGGAAVLRGLVGRLEACRSLGSADSLWVVVDKRRPLSPLKYVPSGLVVPGVTYPRGERMRSDAAAALVAMFKGATTAGAGSMSIASGYRSYSTQYSVYWHRVSTNGRAYADAWIARPGYSEHQTGLTLDIAPVGSSTCSTHNCLGSTSQGRWLRSNAWRYGFVLRYESGYTDVTGYNPEPWHFRYVGKAVAADYHAGGWHTLEQYFGLPPAPTY